LTSFCGIDNNISVVSREELLAALQLIRSDGLGVRTFFSLLEVFGSAAKALEKLPGMISKKSLSARIQICSKDKVITELNKTEDYGAEIVYFKDPLYPQLLKTIYSYPPIITVLGQNKDLLLKNKISVVGSRNSSINSAGFAKKIARELGEANYVVVSGLARGVDSYAHLGALETGTIAVIAGGIDNIYPLENKDLYQKISENGVIISENIFGAEPKQQNFPQRNRIVSGLSLATLVVEGSLKSGSLITANFALEQNREVFAVPGFPMDSRYSGTNMLIKQGAHLFERVDDLLSVISNGFNLKQEELFEHSNRESLEEYIDESAYEKDTDKIKELILSKLSVTSVALDDLISYINLPRKVVVLSIVELELDNYVRRVGNNVSLVL